MMIEGKIKREGRKEGRNVNSIPCEIPITQGIETNMQTAIMEKEKEDKKIVVSSFKVPQ